MNASARTWIAAATAVLLIAIGIGYVWFGPSEERPRRALSPPGISEDSAERALRRGNFQLALSQAEQLLSARPRSNSLLLIAARASAELGHIEQAIAFCDRCVQDGSEQAQVASWVPCELLFREGQLSAAVPRLEEFLRRFPGDVRARQRLIYLFELCGRRWESQAHLFALLRMGQVETTTLVSMSETSRMFDTHAELAKFASQQTPDPLVRLGNARLALSGGDVERAESELRAVLKVAPDLVEAWVQLGKALLQTRPDGDALDLAFAKWQTELPAAAEAHPDIWLVRSQYAERTGQKTAVARCLWEALKLNPNHSAALYQLGQTLQVLQRPEEAGPLLARHAQLSEYSRAVDRVVGKQPQPKLFLDAAALAKACGRPWEAWGWYGLARSTAPADPLANQQFSQLGQQLSPRTPRTLPTSQPALRLELSSLPLPRVRTERIASNAEPGSLRDSGDGIVTPARTASTAGIRFKQIAESKGIDFQYFSSPTPGAEGKRIFEFGGGGVVILDMDLDGWPDLYLTQGCRWPAGDNTPPNALANSDYYNQLYRNFEGKRFQKVPRDKAAADTGFGQGATSGDFNSDGFPDIYVANIGANHLFINNGDGTFSDASHLLEKSAERWTTSCVMADLNADGHPDIYDINYLQGPDLYTRVCRWPQGRQRICGPATFSAAPDTLYLNRATTDETPCFRAVSQQAGFELPRGNGLGVVAARFAPGAKQEHETLQLFVANDQEPNFLLEFGHGQEEPTFRETAILRGLAYDGRGAAQACMGVAAGDADGDGSLDLFVTNYYAESNALYVQRRPGLFEDVSQQADLRDASFSLLGFGTQFLDADLDGDLDLVLTNGHLDDFSYLDQPYEMPPQCFRNEGYGRFEELAPSTLGSYFEGLYRGRSLAKLDWNRDGLPDFVVSHLDAPVALLSNVSSPVGKHIRLELRGVESSRDAVGTEVTIVAGEQQWTRQLTAGDGYQASNERQLIFGIGERDSVDRILIDWPSGRRQEFGELTARRAYLIVEGKSPQTVFDPALAP